MDNENYQNPQQTEQQKPPRSAYTAALLHIFFPILGFGYFYRAEHNKGIICVLLFLFDVVMEAIAIIVACLSSQKDTLEDAYTFIAGGVIIILLIWIMNIMEAVALFFGGITIDKKGRTLHQDFILNIHTDK